MAEGLGRSIQAAIVGNRIKGLPLHGIHPPISHSQFVDDSLLMGTPTVREANAILDILQVFAAASGMECNKEKSQIFFFNTPPPIQRHITEILGFSRSSLPSKYLGIPLIDNPLRNSSWEHLLSSFAKRLSSWTLRALNLPSRLVLLRSVLQALSIYSFSAMAAPRNVLSIIRNLQRNFLWQGFNTGKKIALVSWDKLCRPKAHGGLGLRDPLIMNKVLTAKIWWRWLKQPQDLWARFWRTKYTSQVAEKNLIRWDGDSPGSLIWTAAKQNKQVVTQNAFWEIRNGKTALFWQDSWQQWPILAKATWAESISPSATLAGLTRVADYWQENSPEDKWRKWHLDKERINLDARVDVEPWQEEMSKRKILKLEGEDILRWGHRPKGTFSTQEAYQLLTQINPPPTNELWRKIWSLQHWPKVTLFLWLISHSSILTWDTLSKRGFTGPSICLLCERAEETMNHLLNSCSYTAQLWDQLAIIMRTTDRQRESIIETIAEWRDHAFHSPLLNRIWQLLPGFILWQVWKERNRRVFRNLSQPWQSCWQQCRNHVLETISLQHWSDDTGSCAPSELLILQQWQPLPFSPPSTPSPPPLVAVSPSSWSPPPYPFIKLNFDGASKGNPGAAGYGAVIRDHLGHLLLIAAGSLGHTTNNAAELWGLIRGLHLANELGVHNVVVEGDSQIILNILQRILKGANPDKVTPSWRLSHGIQLLSSLIRPTQAIIPSHVRRQANQVADELANIGTTWTGPDLLCISAQEPEHPTLQQCIRKAATVDSPPDGVVLRATWPNVGEGGGQRSTEPCARLVPHAATIPGL
jgi:ribonuclease HI